MTTIHPAHAGHDLRCVTFACKEAGDVRPGATPAEHDEEHHVVRCITCHTWADDDPRPRQAQQARVEKKIAEREADENGTLW